MVLLNTTFAFAVLLGLRQIKMRTTNVIILWVLEDVVLSRTNASVMHLALKDVEHTTNLCIL